MFPKRLNLFNLAAISMEAMAVSQAQSPMPARVRGVHRLILVFCCIGALAILDSLHVVDSEPLAWWLAERQLPSGGLNGRPEKKEDVISRFSNEQVCYSWWVLSCLDILGKRDYISRDKLIEFILSSQDSDGGIADRPEDLPDVFHTLFGIAGLALLDYPGLESVDPRYCMPKSCLLKYF